MDSVDIACFNGDAGATGTDADIVGMQTASITETTLTQAKKILAFDTIEEFADLIDGKYSASMGDLNIVSSVGANKVWLATQANTNRNETMAQIMMANGLTWTTRGGIDANSAAGDFGAYIGLNRGIDGSAIAAVWDSGQLLRDPYGDHATKGEVALTLNYLWNLSFPRTANFKRLKFVA